MTFGEWVRSIRNAKHLTIAECANRAHMNWSVWQRIEMDLPRRTNGDPPQPTKTTVLRIATGLQVSDNEALIVAGYLKEAGLQPETKAEDQLLAFYRNLPLEWQSAAVAMMKGLVQEQQREYEIKEQR